MVQLSEVAEHCLGKMLDAVKNRGRPLPYLRNPNVQWLQIDTTDLQTMLFEPHEDERYGLREGDVIVCEGGEAGRAAIWDGRLRDVKFQKALHRVRPGPLLDGKYLVYRLMADYHNGRLSDYYTGATIKHLTGQDLARYQFPLPPLAEQRRIVAILDKTDALRAKRRGSLANLDTLARAVFVEIFGDPATNSKRWPIGRIADLIESADYGTSNKAGAAGEFPILRMNNITARGEMNLTDLKYIDLPLQSRERFLVQSGDVLFNRTNSRELVGKTAVFHGSHQMAYAGYLIRLRMREGHRAEYLSGFLNSGYGKRVLQTMCKSIIGMANINATELKAIRIPVPPSTIQSEYASGLAAIGAQKIHQQRSSAELDALFACLQHRVFRGEL